jgi:hypothetical protein
MHDYLNAYLLIKIMTSLNTTPESTTTAEWKSTISPKFLTKFNKIMFVLHLVQGLLMIFLGTLLEFSRQLYTFYYNYSGLPLIPPYVDPKPIYDFTALGAAVGAFLLMSAFAHFLLAWPLNKRYIANLQRNYNPIRWFEYAFSSSVMIVLIAIFFTIVDVWTLFALFVSNFLMNMLGLLMEKHNQTTKKTDWTAFILGVIAGLVPWIVITGYFLGTDGTPPNFVYAIYIIEFILFNCFAWVMLAYFKKWGKFKDYAYGERVYQILSLVAKTLLAWLVFGGIFQPA